MEGIDYYFVGLEGFKEKITNNEFVEWQQVYPDQYYGTLKSELDRIWNKGHHVIFDVDVIGGLNLKKFFGEQLKVTTNDKPDLHSTRIVLLHKNKIIHCDILFV